jgi:hypothetical protein
MATYLERANDIVAAAIDGTPTAEQKQRIADAAIKYRSDLLESLAVDPENPTGEEKAAVFVEALRAWAKSWLRAMAEKDAVAANDATVAAAGDAAELDV